MLEVMVHLDDYRVLQHYTLLEVRLPSADVLSLPADQLPEDWRTDPAPPETAEIGDAWLAEGASLALAVPSVIVPREQNFILNTSHPIYNDVVSNARQIDFEPDRRL